MASGIQFQEGCRIKALQSFETDDAPGYSVQVEASDTGAVVCSDDGWVLVDFVKDSGFQHWVGPGNIEKLSASLVDCFVRDGRQVDIPVDSWAGITHGFVGTVMSEAGRKCSADFRTKAGWIGSIRDFEVVEKIAPHELRLVLDIDGTLLSEAAPDNCKDLRPYLRPHLDEFLDSIFSFCGGVGIWTAASREHLESFLEAVDPEKSRPWAFAWNGKLSFQQLGRRLVDSSCCDFQGMYLQRHRVKRLKKIWRNKRLRYRLGYSRHSTLIVDNTPEVCSDNYGNAIYISTYWSGSDDELLILAAYLRELTRKREVYGQNASVLHVEKRGWYLRTTVGT